ncbi:MAG TPA: hypothetical protein PKI20_15670 [Verrucomicrobiota bacterium]|jgi:hypothetical protein|nr:hypothetical protein [Verrucomicrobiota bacterium]HQL79144.1 hypothetical protein [Verrucomicrobiota bacterium]
MQTRLSGPDLGTVGAFLRGELSHLRAWSEGWQLGRMAFCAGVICVGAGLYGAAMGCWRAPLAALFVAIKFPLIILLTTLGNTLLNAMLAPLLGLNISLRQSFLAILISFTIVSAILGAFSPLIAFMVWNAPPMTPDPAQSAGTYTFIQLSHVVVIAFAGVAGNLRLVQLLRELSGNAAGARRVLLVWLAGNLFLGSQLTWILRPFIGSPGLPVEFLRPTAFQGNFYETVFQGLLRLANADQP